MEREVLFTGIGGQGVQLAAKTLAVAGIGDGRQTMVFGTYAGSMRGKYTDATVVIADDVPQTPPTIDEAWLALAMHPDYWPNVRKRLRPGGLAVVNSSVFRGEVEVEGCQVIPVDASTIATALGHPMAGSMIALGALAAATGLVSLEALLRACEEVLPSYRAAHAKGNRSAVQRGYESIPQPVWRAWETAGVAA